MNRRHGLLLVLVSLGLPLSGCVTWSPATASPEALLQQPTPPPRMRITRVDGEQLVLEGPRIRAGALVATEAPGAVLLADVRTVEVERVNVLRTAALVVGPAVVLFIIGKQACRC